MSRRSSSMTSIPNYGGNKHMWVPLRSHRVSYEQPEASDARMMEAYKKAHASDSSIGSADMAMVQRGNFCRKCLLHVKVCRSFGENLRKAETADVVLHMQNLNIQADTQSKMEKEKAELKAQGRALSLALCGEESKENFY
ncbi:hypothetical protein KR093_007737 [Drosophila rubida]|uniref:Uncharacterized protein n=1 Tax=Drosophila rubida TaxID=30044 RepID=A0AAD4PS96_9MUSC|nr:hypothetical protein KR093_007737 [Drosophila rubida]